MCSYYEPTSPLKKKTSNQRVIAAMLLVAGIIFMISFLFIGNQGIFDSQIEKDNLMKTSENERFGDANNILPTQIEPQVSEPIVENFDQIPKPSPEDKKEK